MRVEKDLLGEYPVPEQAYYGIHTARALDNFTISRYVVHPRLITALAVIKKAAAVVNSELKVLSPAVGAAIRTAAEEVIAGQWREQFVVDALQGGAGTSTNMNVNEVLANRANEILGVKPGRYDIVHPLNHVNLHQSTNDTYSTALRIAAIWLVRELTEACALLQQELQNKEAEFAGVVKVGRTQLQDAVPISLGQEFSAYAQAISRDRWRLYKAEERLRQVNLGGTAIGTGLNAPKKYIYMINDRVKEYTNIGLSRAENMIDATQNADVYVEVSGLLKALAVNLVKIANDLRLMSSGPAAGLGEIKLPERQAGSSIMPGKVNPIIPEAVNQAAFHVMASDFAITMAAQAGQLELNAFLPLIAHHLLGSMEVLANCVTMFREKCIAGVSANTGACQLALDASLVTAAALLPHLGYDQTTLVAQTSARTGQTVLETVRSLQVLSDERLAAILNPRSLIKPGIPGE